MSLFQQRDDKLLHTAQWSDSDRMSFLQNLDEADCEVTKWEAEFIGNTLAYASEREEFSFTPKQRAVIEKLYADYNEHI